MAECSHCERQVLSRGLCAMHYRRHRRGEPLDKPAQQRLSPRAAAFDKSLALAEADSEDDSAAQRAEDAWAKSIANWRDPLVLRENGSRGGLIGGPLRAQRLGAERRQEIARIAGRARAGGLDAEGRKRLARQAAQARWHASLRGQAGMRTTPRKPAHRAESAQPPANGEDDS